MTSALASGADLELLCAETLENDEVARHVDRQALSAKAQEIARGRDALFRGTRYRGLVLASGYLASSPPERAVAFTRSPDVAAHFATLPRDRQRARPGEMEEASVVAAMGSASGRAAKSKPPHMSWSLCSPLASIRASPAHFQGHLEIRGNDSFSSRERETAMCEGTVFPAATHRHQAVQVTAMKDHS
jgi:hypothetical protein